MTLTMHMVTSLDGFVSRTDNDPSWMNATWSPYKAGAEMTAEVLETIDCYVMGSKTYELALDLGWVYGNTRTIVATSRALTSTRSGVEFYSGDLRALATSLTDQNVWLVGGPTLCREFLRLGLVDQLCLTIAPILLGQGLPLIDGDEQKLCLKKTTAFDNGMIDVWYEVIHAVPGDGG